ncbi:hypothetical protein Peur_035572 [Populus x canadensis]
MLGEGFVPNIVLYTCLINHFLRMGEFKYAFRLFDLMVRKSLPGEDVFTVSTHSPRELKDLASKLMQKIKGTRDIEIDRAIGLFNRMSADGCAPDRCAYSTLLKSLYLGSESDVSHDKMVIIGRLSTSTEMEFYVQDSSKRLGSWGYYPLVWQLAYRIASNLETTLECLREFYLMGRGQMNIQRSCTLQYCVKPFKLIQGGFAVRELELAHYFHCKICLCRLSAIAVNQKFPGTLL